ncbi:hypothetical protein AC579_1061 [Pseudocercospora musae]|uniref:Uncharacterized protein n=1 Tax=Pseudocercospora musae TaxID=113226 RepID=A0A139HZ97_9PEZI|nr:hypothetical protein AC579_1061 [Pseudocercospora musae]
MEAYARNGWNTLGAQQKMSHQELRLVGGLDGEVEKFVPMYGSLRSMLELLVNMLGFWKIDIEVTLARFELLLVSNGSVLSRTPLRAMNGSCLHSPSAIFQCFDTYNLLIYGIVGKQ